MNCNTLIAHNPFKHLALFLSLIGGPKVEGWVE
jgi:hypothetical protein